MLMKSVVGPILCPETSVNNYHTTPCNYPEDHRFNLQNSSLHAYFPLIMSELSNLAGRPVTCTEAVLCLLLYELVRSVSEYERDMVGLQTNVNYNLQI
jgi:hypothetical protein